MLGAAIIRHGTPEQQARILPRIASGDFSFYLGYSEPEVGSDLASLRTRAVRDGDAWIVNGRKMWGTGAHRADWVWLAARTDPDTTPPHAGITVFLTRTDRPGFELQQHMALSGEISCSTFFDDFRIPDTDRIGEVNGGWRVITDALARERVLMAGNAATLLRLLDDMLAEIRTDPHGTVGPRGSAKRRLISELAARLQAARALVNASVRATAKGGDGARLEAPMAKIIATQLMEDFSEAALRIFGPSAALGEGLPGVPGRGAFEANLRVDYAGGRRRQHRHPAKPGRPRPGTAALTARPQWSARAHADRAVEADRLSVQHRVAHDGVHQVGVLGGVAQSRRVRYLRAE
jgi:alkylation response protein AidB-like acyl-CoA dehydrogenase